MNDIHRHRASGLPSKSKVPGSAPAPRRSSLLEQASFRRILSTKRFVVMLSTFLLALLLGLGTLSFFLVTRIFDQLTPAIARDLSWKAERGVAELMLTTQLGLALGESARLEQASGSYLQGGDVKALIVRDASGKVVLSHPPGVAPDLTLFRRAPSLSHEDALAFSAWAPVDIEGTELGSVALSISKDRLAAGDELRRNILATMVVGAIIALILAAFFVSLYIAPLIRLTEKAFMDLEERTREALESARLKSEFLANMSHEIRTPMNGVIGMAELLQKTPLSGKQRRYSRTITTSASALLTIINDILDFSKIEAGKLSVRSIETDVRHLAEEVAQLHAAQGNAKGIEVMCVIAPDVPKEVMIDHDRLRQVLNNVMSNAVKFTNTGNVVLRVWVAERSPDAVARKTWRVGFSVTDSGIGIAPEDQERVFELFSQVDGSLTRTRGGTGLGLTISRHLVSLMGGHLRLKSEVGKGSCFDFVLPVEVLDENSALPDQRLPRTLIVDDNGTNLTVLEEILQMWGVPTESAHSGEEALEILQRPDPDGGFELVLVDYHLQGMLGTDLARNVRDRLRHRKPRLVLLTSMASVEGEDSLFDDSLSKPVLQDDLRRVVLGLGSQKSDHADIMTSLAFVGRPRILVAEDNPINREVMREILDELEIDSDMAENGQQALEALDRRDYPVVLMDCQMPVLDGYEAARRIRARTDNRADVPIIAVTAHAVVGEREKAISAGMSDYVTKPVTITRLARALANYLETRTSERPQISVDELEEHAALAAADLAQDHSEPPKGAPEDSQNDGPLDRGTRRSKVVISLFRKMVPEQIELLDKAVISKDSIEVKKLAHRLKGSCLALGAKSMAAVCASLEPMPDVASDLMTELREAHEAVLTALNAEEKS